jgi:hypothetical protein
VTDVSERPPDEDAGDADEARDDRQDTPPVDGPGGAGGNDEAGGTSYDEPGGREHGT